MALPTNRVTGGPVQAADINAIAAQSNANEAALAGKAATNHTHDDRYPQTSQVNSALAGKADSAHTHDSRYVRTVNGTGPDEAGNVTVSGGGGGGVTDHGALDGLGDDDHPQYLTEQRGDARYAAAGHDHGGTYAAAGHHHDDRYPTATQVADALEGKADAEHTHSGHVTSTTVAGLWQGTQAAYDALGSYDPATLYFIQDA